jgi:hypothetical protein
MDCGSRWAQNLFRGAQIADYSVHTELLNFTNVEVIH